jgi:hypothetical protein
VVRAELGERRLDDRATHRNGYWPRRWDARSVDVLGQKRSRISTGRAVNRAKRRMARRPALPLRRIDLSRHRDLRQSHTQPKQGGHGTRRGLTANVTTDDHSVNLLHHVPGLDSHRPDSSYRCSKTLKASDSSEWTDG